MLSKNQIVTELAEKGLGGKKQIKNILDGLAELAEAELESGENFVVPGIARLTWKFTPAAKKGERYKAGDTVKGPQGERVAEEDSPARKQKIRLGVYASSAINKIKKDPTSQKRATKKAKK